MSARNRPTVHPSVIKAALETLENRQLFALAVTPFNPGSASTLTNALVESGTGLTATGSSYVGVNGQGGTYSGLDYTSNGQQLKIGNGIILTSGSAAAAVGPNSNTGISTTAGSGSNGDADLTTLITGSSATTIQSFDANSLTLTFTASASTKSVLFDFVFGSDEFPEFVGQFNDAFGAYLDGKQISVDANNKPVTVNNNLFTLNNSGDTSDPDTVGKTVVSYDLQYDGLTPKIVTQAPLDLSKTTHTLKFVIGDAADHSLDSGVFLANLRGSNQIVGEPTTGQPPVVDAHGPYTVAANGTVQLTGTATDPDTVPAKLVYTWDLDGDGVYGETGAAAANGAENVQNPTYKAGAVTATKTVALKVVDDTGLFGTDTAIINVTTASPTNTPPTANAGGTYTFNEGSPVKLNGSGTDADGDPLTYSYDLNNDGTFGDAVGATPTVTWATLVGLGIKDNGTYAITLQVSDGKSVTTAGGSLAIQNVAPTANAGVDQSVKVGAAVTLNGTATDPAGAADPITYGWQVVNTSGVVVASGAGQTITFTPAAAGTYTGTLTASDDDGGVGTDTVLINVGPVAPVGQAVTSYTLVNADTDKDIMTITNGMTINLATLKTTHLNIRANTSPTPVGSVRITYDGKTTVENAVPYAVLGDKMGDYAKGVLSLGSHSLSATPYTGKKAAGAAGTALPIQFTVVNQKNPVAVQALALYNTKTDKWVTDLTEGKVIDLSDLGLTLGNITVRALTTPTIVGSVKFVLDGTVVGVENFNPYTLYQNHLSDYYGGSTLSIGKHAISVTPFSLGKGKGVRGATLGVNFTIKA